MRSAIGPNAAAGLEIVRLGEIDDARGRVLVRSRAPFAPVTAKAVGDGAVEFTNPIVLVRPPYRVSFAFAGRDRIWKETWADVKQMPNAVRVTVRNDVTGEILPVSTAALDKCERPGRMRYGRSGWVRRPVKDLQSNQSAKIKGSPKGRRPIGGSHAPAGNGSVRPANRRNFRRDSCGKVKRKSCLISPPRR